jgi:uncharacterized membrane protein
MNQGRAYVQWMLMGLPFAALLISCIPFLLGHYPQGDDWGLGFVRIAEFRHALLAGQLPPYWSENSYAGYGSPVFLYYAPVFSFVASLVTGIFDSIVNASAATVVIFSMISLVGMEKLMREVIGDGSPESFAAARVAVYVYVLNPYLLGDKLMRNANAEFAALCIAPFVLYGLLRIRTDQRRGLIVLATAFAIIILSHNLTALVVATLVLFSSLVLYLPSASMRECKAIIYAVVLGLGLSAFFWLPALGLMSLVRPEELTGGKFDFHTNFQPLGSFFSYDDKFSLGYVGLELLIFAVCMAFFIGDKAFPARRMYIFVLVFAAVFLFLQIPASTFLWEQVPYLSFFQFPWRMMGPFALMLAIASGIAFAYVLRKRPGRFGLFAELTVFIICVFNAVPQLRSYPILAPETEKYQPELLSPQGIQSHGFTSTVGHEYLPRTAHADAWKSQPPVHGPIVRAEPPARIITRIDQGTKIILDVEAEQPSRLRLARWAFPGWQLALNGRSDEVLTNEFGSIDISVPAGKTTVVLELRPPLLRRVCVWISMASLALLIMILLGWPHQFWTRRR